MISILVLLLAAGPSGSLSGGRVPKAVTNTIYVSGTATTALSITTHADVQLQEARWVTQTTVAGAAGTMAIALRDDGSPVCTILIPCDSATNSIVSTSCGGATILQASSVTITVDRSACVGTAPTGNLSYVIFR